LTLTQGRFLMQLRDIKRNVNKKKPGKFTFSASVQIDGVWQRFKKTFWTRTSDYKITVKPGHVIHPMILIGKGKPMSLKGL
jgi:hypothetical protein